MVAIFTGAGAGFDRGSGSLLGSQGLLGSAGLGRGGEQLFLNAATGNLMVSQRDEYLVGLGLDAAVSRTYNSLGDFTDDNGDNWRQGYDRRISLSGTLNSAGSTAQRVSGDGSVITYSWDAARSAYVTTDGSGAYDTLTSSGGVWTWTDGDSQIKETYTAYSGGWRLASQSDTDGNTLSFTYTGANLTRVTTADGSFIDYSWSGSNLTQVATGYTDLGTATAKTLTRTRYAYDGSNRLASVTVDLSPEDNSIADAKTYVTTYSYVGTSKLVASILQSDGSRIDIGYDASNRVTSLSQTASSGVARVTGVSYNAGYTLVTDPLGLATRFDYNADGSLAKVTLPAAAAGAGQQRIQFGYSANGDVTSVTDALGNVTSYSNFDANGNAWTVTDRLGNIVTRTYGAKNELLTETSTSADPISGAAAHTVRFAYDSENHLRYRIGANGSVTEYRYTATGQISQTIEYPEQSYDVVALEQVIRMYDLALGRAPNSSEVVFWTSYMANNVPNYVQPAAEGWPAIGPYGEKVNALEGAFLYIMSDSGVQARFSSTDNALFVSQVYQNAFRRPAATAEVNVWLGNMAAGWTRAGILTYFSEYPDHRVVTASMVAQAPVVTEAVMDGWRDAIADKSSVQTSLNLYDARGGLISSESYGIATTAGAGSTAEGSSKTIYIYDQAGNLRSRNALGRNVETYVYDGLNRATAAVDVNGATTTYVFNDAATTTTVSFATGLTQVSTYNKAGELISFAETATATTLGAATGTATYAYDKDGRLRWQVDATGRKSYFVYDQLGRKVADVSSLGDVVKYYYDANNRQIAQVAHNVRLTSSQIASLDNENAVLDPNSVTPSTNVADRWNWNVYDKEGRLLQTIAGDGSTSVNSYDGAGRLLSTSSYSNKLSEAQLNDLRAAVGASLTPNMSDPAQWSFSGAGISSTTIGGNPATLMTVQQNGVMATANSSISVKAGEVVTFELTL